MAIWWSDNEKRWGPFLYHKSEKSEGNKFEVTLRANTDYEPACNLLIRIGPYTFMIKLPRIIKPEKTKVKVFDDDFVRRTGRAWYYAETPRKYGISLYDDLFCIYYGRETMDSSTEQYWGKFVPWMTTRHVRLSFYDQYGKLTGEIFDCASYEEQKKIEDITPKVFFVLKDFDGEEIIASTHIEEREWRRGTGWFKWISVFYKPMIHRYLEISFNKEVGPEKGSWKGGTMGHSIEIDADELHYSGIQRYCNKYNLTYIGEVVIST